MKYPVITFYGPAESPWVTIGTEFYQCRQTIYEGEYIVYNAKNRTVTGYIESAREPDENSYSVGVPDDWESGMTLYRAAMITDENGDTHYIGGDDAVVVRGWLSMEVDDVILSAESEYFGHALNSNTTDIYLYVSDVLTLGSGDEDTAAIGAYLDDYYDGYGSVFFTDNDTSLSGYPDVNDNITTTYAEGTVTYTATATASDYLACYAQTLEGLGVGDEDVIEIEVIHWTGSFDTVTLKFELTTSSGATVNTSYLEVGKGDTGTLTLDVSGAGILLTYVYFSSRYSTASAASGAHVTLAGGYVTPQGMRPVSGQMVYACDSVGEKNWFEYRNLDLDPFEPVEPGEHNVYFESGLSFDLTILEERSEPPWT